MTTTTAHSADLKKLIQDLHNGLPPEEAKARFNEIIKDVSPEQIGAMEEELIREGMPVQEIQRLCDVHVAVVKAGLDRQDRVSAPPGHPIHTYMKDNEEITRLAEELGSLSAEVSDSLPESARLRLEQNLEQVLSALAGIHNHYLRKEHQLFPYLERHGITGPSQVMWGVHDEIRARLKGLGNGLQQERLEWVASGGAALARSLTEMVYKEDNILFPLAMQNLTLAEWREARFGEDELGYAFVEPEGDFPLPRAFESLPQVEPSGAGVAGPGTTAQSESVGTKSIPLPIASLPNLATPLSPGARAQGFLDLGTGRLSLEQVDMVLRHLPVDLSFVDADGYVRYYSETADRIFPRTPGAIGRHVENCHPPKSVHMVKEILRAFSAGERDVAEFWIEMGGKFIHIRYFAVRNPEGEFLGTLEVSQDVTAIRGLEGQRRLLEWS